MSSSKINKFLISLLVFLLPTQLAYHFWPSYAFIFGIRIDYLSPAVYLTDLLCLVIIFTNLRKIKNCYKYLFLLIVFGFVNTFFSSLPFVSIYKWIKIFEFVCVYLVVRKADITKPLYFSLIFFSLIGILQVILSKTTGLFYFLGERSFDINTPSIALGEIGTYIFMRAYSTFSHPNAMAGYISLSSIYLIHKKYKFNWLIIFPLTCFVFNFSLSAVIGLMVYFILKNNFNRNFIIFMILLSFVTPFIDSRNYRFGSEYLERINLAKDAGVVISEHFWLGSGLGTFTKYSYLRQPVHNLFLLMFSEVGVIGLLSALCIVYKNFKSLNFFIFVFVVGLFDHYFLTIQQTSLLLFIITSVW